MQGGMKMSWKKYEEGWHLEYNSLISCINRGIDVDDVKNLDPDDREWYIQSKKKLDEENERIRQNCIEKGIPVWKTSYSMVYEDGTISCK